MKPVLLLLLCIVPTVALAQAESADSPPRTGFFLGAAAGDGILDLTGGGATAGYQVTPSFPNLKIGYMLSSQAAVLVLLPGTIYMYRGGGDEDRSRDRGFEGIIPSIQYWVADRWWLMGGAGLTLDAPTFYDVRQPSEGKYYFGPALSLSMQGP